MAGRGPAPNPNAVRRKTAVDKVETVVLPERLDEPVGPELPEWKIPWPPRTKAWWETWRHDPVSLTFGPTDWDFLLDTARLHAALWRLDDEKVSSRTGLAAEIRLRVAKYGATPEDRLRLRLERGNDVPPTHPARLADDEPVDDGRRARLLKAVDGRAG